MIRWEIKKLGKGDEVLRYFVSSEMDVYDIISKHIKISKSSNGILFEEKEEYLERLEKND
jgi:hypothetical protein